MISNRYLKFGYAGLLLSAGLAASGCGSVSVYRPKPEELSGLTPPEARRLLMKVASGLSGCPPVDSGKVTYEHLRTNCASKPYRYADSPALLAMTYRGDPVEGRGEDKTCINSKEVSISRSTGRGDWRGGKCLFYSLGIDLPAARDFVRAWTVLARDGAAFQLAQDAAFEVAAKTYRDAAEKPQLPEGAVRFKVQAEAAVQQKRFSDAVDLYDQALEIAPWWPAGRYNRGLILGELKDYEGAIGELKRYLKIDPDAANARAVQLKIYEWEGLVPKAAK